MKLMTVTEYKGDTQLRTSYRSLIKIYKETNFACQHILSSISDTPKLLFKSNKKKAK